MPNQYCRPIPSMYSIYHVFITLDHRCCGPACDSLSHTRAVGPDDMLHDIPVCLV